MNLRLWEIQGCCPDFFCVLYWCRLARDGKRSSVVFEGPKNDVQSQDDLGSVAQKDPEKI